MARQVCPGFASAHPERVEGRAHLEYAQTYFHPQWRTLRSWELFGDLSLFRQHDTRGPLGLQLQSGLLTLHSEVLIKENILERKQ